MKCVVVAAPIFSVSRGLGSGIGIVSLRRSRPGGGSRCKCMTTGVPGTERRKA